MVLENGSTKVYYHLDDSTPYMSILPVPADAVTLGDFRKVFNRRGYIYFCKEFDSTLNDEVKVAVTSDTQRLHRSAKGHIELYLMSQDGPSMGASASFANASGTLPRSKRQHSAVASTTVGFPMSNFRLNKRRSSALALSSIVDEMDVGGGQRVSMVTNDHRSMSGEASSDINTFISKRAGEHLAELYTSTSEDPYKFDLNSAPSFTSSSVNNNYSHLLISNYTIQENEDDDDASSVFHKNVRQRKPRRQKYRKAYVPSTISSASESSLSISLPRVDEVKIAIQDDLDLGISVACNDGGIFISRITAGSAADKCGRLEVGDQIVQVGKISFETLSDEDAINEIRKAWRSKSKKAIKIFVAKRPRVSDQKSDALSLLCETLQLNVSDWVEQTTKQQEVEMPFDEFSLNTNEAKTAAEQSQQQHRHVVGSANFGRNFTMPANGALDAVGVTGGEETSDEERAAYADRRNGVGPMLVPALQSRKRTDATAHAVNANMAGVQHSHYYPQQQQQQVHQPQQRLKLANNPNTSYLARPAASGAQTNGNIMRLAANCRPEDGAMPAVVNFRNKNDNKTTANNNNDKAILSVGMDPGVILRQMARPNSGLVIKDRKWLKIPVPNSFIGDEMVNWLLENVSGFRDRKAVKTYASMLLSNGYIKHVVNMTNFNEKCYYIFEDSIINERMRVLQQQASQSTLASSTNTASTRLAASSGGGCAGTLPSGLANGGGGGGTTANNIAATSKPVGLTTTANAVCSANDKSITEITYMSSPLSPGGFPISAGAPTTNVNMLQLPPSKPILIGDGLQLQPRNLTIGAGGIVKMASNPRYVSPPLNNFTRSDGAMPIRLSATTKSTDANNNGIIKLVGGAGAGGPTNMTGMTTKAQPPELASPLAANRGLNSIGWPSISHNHMFGNHNNANGGNHSSRDCGSPTMTNDYASMIQGEINCGAQFDTLDSVAAGGVPLLGGRPPASKENHPPPPTVAVNNCHRL